MNEYFFPCNLFLFNISRVDLQNLLLVCFTWTIINCNLQMCDEEVHILTGSIKSMMLITQEKFKNVEELLHPFTFTSIQIGSAKSM